MLKRNVKFVLLALRLFVHFPFAANAASVNGLFRHEAIQLPAIANGYITIVEFFDYQCSHCIDMAPVIDSVIKLIRMFALYSKISQSVGQFLNLPHAQRLPPTSKANIMNSAMHYC